MTEEAAMSTDSKPITADDIAGAVMEMLNTLHLLNGLSDYDPVVRTAELEAQIASHEGSPIFDPEDPDYVLAKSLLPSVKDQERVRVPFDDNVKRAVERFDVPALRQELVKRLYDFEDLTNLERYRKVYGQTEGTHPCEVGGCHLSQEEHHRLAFGFINENSQLRQRVRELEGQ